MSLPPSSHAGLAAPCPHVPGGGRGKRPPHPPRRLMPQRHTPGALSASLESSKAPCDVLNQPQNLVAKMGGWGGKCALCVSTNSESFHFYLIASIFVFFFVEFGCV